MFTFTITDPQLAEASPKYGGLKARFFVSQESDLPHVTSAADVVLMSHVRVSLLVLPFTRV